MFRTDIVLVGIQVNVVSLSEIIQIIILDQNIRGDIFGYDQTRIQASEIELHQILMQSLLRLPHITSGIISSPYNISFGHVWLVWNHLISFICFSNQKPFRLLTCWHTADIKERLTCETGKLQIQRQNLICNFQSSYNIIKRVFEEIFKFFSSIIPELINALSRHIDFFLSKELEINPLKSIAVKRHVSSHNQIQINMQ